MIYLDNNATTKLDPRVLASMLPFLEGAPLNASSLHRYGQEAKGHLAQATRQIAAFFDVRPQEIVFTSCATEALNMLIRGFSFRHSPAHIISSSLEHLAVLKPLEELAKAGHEVTHLVPSISKGSISRDQIEKALKPTTQLIVLMGANNETGILTDLEAIAHLAQEKRIPLLVDGVAWIGKSSCSIPKGISACCFSGHKIHGPRGIGGAFIRKPYHFSPLILGGAQQNGKRGGTENLPAIIGLATAFELLKEEGQRDRVKMQNLRDHLEKSLIDLFPEIIIHGAQEKRVCNTSNMAFPGIDGETLLMKLDLEGVAASSGSACSAGLLETSRVLLNMGVSKELANSSLRFSLSKFTTENEINRTIEVIKNQLVPKKNPLEKLPVGCM